MRKLTPETLKAAILEGLEGAESSEADRIREGIEWLFEDELEALTKAVNAKISGDGA